MTQECTPLLKARSRRTLRSFSRSCHCISMPRMASGLWSSSRSGLDLASTICLWHAPAQDPFSSRLHVASPSTRGTMCSVSLMGMAQIMWIVAILRDKESGVRNSLTPLPS
jgi:hypothetical protein